MKIKALVLAEATADGMRAAGLGDLGDILYATVGDMVAGGDVAEAMDLAKQGFSRLQKIKAPRSFGGGCKSLLIDVIHRLINSRS